MVAVIDHLGWNPPPLALPLEPRSQPRHAVKVAPYRSSRKTASHRREHRAWPRAPPRDAGLTAFYRRLQVRERKRRLPSPRSTPAGARRRSEHAWWYALPPSARRSRWHGGRWRRRGATQSHRRHHVPREGAQAVPSTRTKRAACAIPPGARAQRPSAQKFDPWCHARADHRPRRGVARPPLRDRAPPP